ncbi:disease resistance protein RPV1-like [Coffea arabica]|uniref:Disease resistance protein RPV1-like n=1 Tax=Coffea arabica TaxID=13443 RepID=A0A6P6TZ36_COFAR|nr:TMV resistance protein N-like [Coffea arabica]
MTMKLLNHFVEIVASSSSSFASTPKWTYDVFLSFRGEDVRKSFVYFLYSALQKKGIYTFKDDESLKDKDPFHLHYANLLKSQELQLSFSQKTMLLLHGVWMSLQRSLTATTMRKQKGSFGKAFVKVEDEVEDKERVQKWRAALAEASSTSGWDVPKTASG